MDEELSGFELDLATADALGMRRGVLTRGDASSCVIFDRPNGHEFQPSTNWNDGGPLIEQYRISLHSYFNGDWEAMCLGAPDAVFNIDQWKRRGPTLLIAAMRALVAAMRTTDAHD